MRELLTRAKTELEEAMYGFEDRALFFVTEALTATIKDSLTPEPAQYEANNPLGGPAKVFDAMAAAIRAGESYEAVLAQYGFVQSSIVPLTDDELNELAGIANAQWLAGHPDVQIVDVLGKVIHDALIKKNGGRA